MRVTFCGCETGRCPLSGHVAPAKEQPLLVGGSRATALRASLSLRSVSLFICTFCLSRPLRSKLLSRSVPCLYIAPFYVSLCHSAPHLSLTQLRAPLFLSLAPLCASLCRAARYVPCLCLALTRTSLSLRSVPVSRSVPCLFLFPLQVRLSLRFVLRSAPRLSLSGPRLSLAPL